MNKPPFPNGACDQFRFPSAHRFSRWIRVCGSAVLGVSLLFPIGAARAAGVGTNSTEVPLSELSIEELLKVAIMSVSKKLTPLNEAPAAVAVLTQEDIRRLGALSLPEALRAVPGLAVGRMNANKWAIGSRGFNDEYANELLVLVDGRSVYTPTFGGVYWNSQDLVVEDLDRIEVIRGPGATLWGANAVNGVINIITKSARDTQGTLLSSSFGTEDQPSVSVRYGGQLASNLFYRIYARHFDREGFKDTLGREMGDGWQVGRGGVRLDWYPSDQNTFTLLGDFYDGEFGEAVSRASLFPPTNVLLRVEAPMNGGFTLGRWQRKISEESDLKVQAYFDHYERDHPFGAAALEMGPGFLDTTRSPGETRDTWDIDLQHRFRKTDRHDVVWGAGYRYTEDQYSPNGTGLSLNPARSGDQLFNVFVQDDITLIQDRVRLTLGSKFERNDYTGLEIQPGARLLWTPTERQSIWASVARAVRTPARFERDAQANLTALPPVLLRLYSNPGLVSEKLLAYEMGYRVETASRLSLDMTAFYNDYRDHITGEPGPSMIEPAPQPHLVVPISFANVGPGQTYGAEALARWRVTDHWRLDGGYAWLRTSLFRRTIASDKDAPQQQFHLRSSLDLTQGWELNAVLYYVDRISVLSANLLKPVDMPAYARFDLGLNWQASKHLELAMWGQNLLDPDHPEFGSYKTTAITEIPRTFYGRVTWRY